MRLKLLAADTWRIYAPCEADGSSFIEDLGGDELEKFRAVVERIAEHGPRVIPEKRNHQVDAKEQLYQLRIDAVRVIWFYDAGKVVICTHAYQKKTQKAPKPEIEAARRVKADYFAAKVANRIVVDEE